jgi:hypothetical protein
MTYNVSLAMEVSIMIHSNALLAVWAVSLFGMLARLDSM